MRLYEEIIKLGDYRPYRRQTMLYLTYTTITSVDLAHYGVSRAKDWVSVDCGTRATYIQILCIYALAFYVYVRF